MASTTPPWDELDQALAAIDVLADNDAMTIHPIRPGYFTAPLTSHNPENDPDGFDIEPETLYDYDDGEKAPWFEDDGDGPYVGKTWEMRFAPAWGRDPVRYTIVQIGYPNPADGEYPMGARITTLHAELVHDGVSDSPDAEMIVTEWDERPGGRFEMHGPERVMREIVA